MSTQSIRNILNTQCESVLVRAEGQIREEGKKKITDLKEKIPKSKDVFDQLKSEISKYACSEKGRKKFQRTYDKIDSKLTKLENILGGALKKIENLENKVKPIFEEEGPLKKIWDIVNFINDEIVPVLVVAKGLIDAALAIQQGLTASGSSIKILGEKAMQIAGKVSEYMMIGIMVPLMIKYYKEYAESLLQKIEPLKSKISGLKERISKLKLLIYGLLTFFKDQCDVHESTGNVSDGNEGVPSPDENNSLNEYLGLMNNYYQDVYQALKGLGDEKAVRREFALKETLEEDYNISFKVINLD